MTALDKLTDEVLDHGAGGNIRTTRFDTVRYWVGHETGDVFGRDCDYDGPTLTIEVADAADAQAMLDAISCDAFRRGVAVGWDERLKQERNNAAVAAHRRASQAAPAPSDGLREALADALDLLKSFGLNDSVAYRNGIAALTPAPAQEGGAWNDAIEAAYQACLTCDGALNNAGAAAVKVRALRRAAPTEDRCAECDCQNGGTECTWIKSGPVAAPTEDRQ